MRVSLALIPKHPAYPVRDQWLDLPVEEPADVALALPSGDWVTWRPRRLRPRLPGARHRFLPGRERLFVFCLRRLDVEPGVEFARFFKRRLQLRRLLLRLCADPRLNRRPTH